MLKNETKLEHVKIHRIKLSDIVHAKELLEFCRANKISKYVYEFKFAGAILKYGHSVSEEHGERMYRQAANIPVGWTSKPRSPSGKDFELVCEDYESEFEIKVNKKHVQLTIYDMTNYPFEFPDNPIKEVKRFEAEQIANYIELHGNRPLGNLRDEAAALIIEETPKSRLAEAGFVV